MNNELTMNSEIGICNCGKPIRYIHNPIDDNPVFSCNKYVVCPTYDELLEENKIRLRDISILLKLIDNVQNVIKVSDDFQDKVDNVKTRYIKAQCGSAK